MPYSSRERKLAYDRDFITRLRYGIGKSDYDAMLASQDGVCALCKEVRGRRALVIDHCHDSGKVRALLCNTCNVALGYFKSNPELLRKAADYLEEFREPDTQYRQFGELDSVSLVSPQIN